MRKAAFFFAFTFLSLQMQGKVFSIPPVKADTLSQHLDVIVTSLMEISRMSELQLTLETKDFPESGYVTTDSLQTDSFRVRANHSFIVALYDAGNYPVQQHMLEMIKPRLSDLVPSVCVAFPLSASEQHVSFNCYCSTDQWFRVKSSTSAGKSLQLIYTATAP